MKKSRLSPQTHRAIREAGISTAQLARESGIALPKLYANANLSDEELNAVTAVLRDYGVKTDRARNLKTSAAA